MNIMEKMEVIFEDITAGSKLARRLVIVVVGIPLFVVAGISVGIVGGIVNAIAQPYVDDTTLVFIMLGVFFAPLIAYLWIPYLREPPSDAAEFRPRGEPPPRKRRNRNSRRRNRNSRRRNRSRRRNSSTATTSTACRSRPRYQQSSIRPCCRRPTASNPSRRR